MSATAISQDARWRLGQVSILKAVIVAIAYLIGAEIAFLIGTLSDKIFAPFWPPNIVLLCTLVLEPPRNWWVYLLAVFPAHVIAELGVGMPFLQMLVAFATNCLVAIFNAFAMQWLLRGPPFFDSPSKALLYMLATALLCPAIVALGGAFVPILGDGRFEDFWKFWFQWYLANALGSLALGPLALIWLSHETTFTSLTGRQQIEAVALAIALAIVCMLAFWISADQIFSVFVPALVLLPLTLFIWLAIRFAATGASAAILIATVVAIQQTLGERSPFVVADPETAVFGLQLFLIVLAVPFLLLGAATEETRRAMYVARANQGLMTLSAAAADVCMWQYDRKADRFWMTENGRAMFGLGADDQLTRVSIEQLMHPEDREASIKAMRSASATNKRADMEFRIIRADGATRWLRVRGRQRKDSAGGPGLLSGTFTDVTERRTAENEAALRRSELAHLTRVSMLGELSVGIAHELTQPLTAILSNAQAALKLLERKFPDTDEIKAALEDIVNDDHRAGEILHRMRGLLRRSELKLELIDLNEIINDTLQLLHSELIQRKATISTAFAGSLPSVSGDRIQLQQVILNLVINAIDSMNNQEPPRRMITIRTNSSPGGDIEVSISDRGTGLSPVQMERIFQPFFTTKERGLGLGLSICSSIIRAHGGKLGLANNPTGGATATISLRRYGEQ